MVRHNYTFSNDRASMERLIKKNPDYAVALEKARSEAKYSRENFADKVEWLSGWAHNFCCPKCASQMIFDINMPYNPLNVYKCPNCGTTASSVDHDEAWVYYYRERFGNYLQSCAVCALFGDKEALDFMSEYVDFYADNYEKFPVHGKHAGKGKIMEQGLDEAVWTLEVLSALNACGDLIPSAKKAEWMDKLYRPMIDLLVPQVKSIDNVSTWLMCCVGVIGIYFGDNELLDFALNSEFGIRNQIAKGFTADGIWFEGSMSYHYYTTSALSKFFSFYALRAPEDKVFDTFAKMYTIPLLLSYDNYHLPAMNDGWYPVHSSFLPLPARICDDKALREVNERAARERPCVLMRPTALLYSVADEDVVVLSDTKLAVVVNPFHVLFKSGVIAQNHMHCDYLSIRISPFSDDLGSPGYGHPMSSGWYRMSASHNAISVDGSSPGVVIPTRMEKIEGGARAVIEHGHWTNLTLAQRTLTVDNERVYDVTELEAPTSHTYDWIFHSKGLAKYSCDSFESVDTLGEDNGYSYFEDIKRMSTGGGSFKASFTIENGETLTLEVPATDGIEVYTAVSPDNPADQKRNSLILRRTACDAKFSVIFTKK